MPRSEPEPKAPRIKSVLHNVDNGAKTDRSKWLCNNGRFLALQMQIYRILHVYENLGALLFYLFFFVTNILAFCTVTLYYFRNYRIYVPLVQCSFSQEIHCELDLESKFISLIVSRDPFSPWT